MIFEKLFASNILESQQTKKTRGFKTEIALKGQLISNCLDQNTDNF